MKRMYAVFEEMKIIKKSENKKELLDYISSFPSEERIKLRLAKEIRMPGEPQQSRWMFEEDLKDARKVIMGFWIVTLIFSLLLSIPWLSGLKSSLSAKIIFYLLTTYILWSTLWGFRLIFSKVEDFLISYEYLFQGIMKDPIKGLLMLPPLFLLLLFVLLAGCIYGCLGGGIYEYLKCRKVAKEQNNISKKK